LCCSRHFSAVDLTQRPLKIRLATSWQSICSLKL
jgi:hypothetical protein